MAETTITVSEDVKEQLADLRSEDHETWNDLFIDVCRIFPTPEEAKTQLEDSMLPWKGSVVKTGGVIQFFDQDVQGTRQYFSVYFPTMESAIETYEQGQHQVPEEPDKIIVGGVSEGRVEVEGNGLSMVLNGDAFQVGFDLPGAFGGFDSRGEPYEYEGEPVYIVNNGDVVQEGVVEEIIHDDFHTTLDLGHDYETTQLHHPDEEVREQYKEEHPEAA